MSRTRKFKPAEPKQPRRWKRRAQDANAKKRRKFVRSQHMLFRMGLGPYYLEA